MKWVSGFVGQLKNLVGANIIAGAAALSACGNGDERIILNPPGGTVSPLPKPKPNEIAPDSTPQNNFNSAFPPDVSLEYTIEGRSRSKTIIDEPDCVGVVSTNRSISFSGNQLNTEAEWDSYPIEFANNDFFDSPEAGLSFQRAQARAAGKGWDQLTRGGFLGFVADAFPLFSDAKEVGYYLIVSGNFDFATCMPGNCPVTYNFGSTEKIDGIRQMTFPYLVFACYTSSPDELEGLAKPDFSNEEPIVLLNPKPVTIQAPTPEDIELEIESDPVALCVGDCQYAPGDPKQGAVTYDQLHMRLVAFKRRIQDDSQSNPSNTSSPDGGAVESDGGIPPL